MIQKIKTFLVDVLAVKGFTLWERIPHARMTLLPASHISNIEAEAAFTGALRDFLRTE